MEEVRDRERDSSGEQPEMKRVNCMPWQCVRSQRVFLVRGPPLYGTTGDDKTSFASLAVMTHGLSYHGGVK